MFPPARGSGSPFRGQYPDPEDSAHRRQLRPSDGRQQAHHHHRTGARLDNWEIGLATATIDSILQRRFFGPIHGRRDLYQ